MQTVGVRLLRGRDFNDSDGPKSTPVVLISESAVKEFGGKDPIGEKIDMGDRFTVIGIVSDARRRSLDTPPRAAVYLPYTQFVLPYMGAVVRTDRGAGAVASAVKAAVAQIDPDLPIGDVKTMEQIIEESTGEPRFRSFLIASFAGPGAAAGGGRRLWVDQLHRHAARARDRRAARARRQPATGLYAGHRPGPAAGRHRRRARAWSAAAAATTLVRGLLFNTSATDPVVYALAVVVAAGDGRIGVLCSG